MAKLPSVKPKHVIKVLQKCGFMIHHIKGSHHKLKHSETGKRVIVALHNKDIKPGTLNAILREAGLSREEFLEILMSV